MFFESIVAKSITSNMTKADIAKELYERNYKWLSRIEATNMVELLIDTLKETLAAGEDIKIPGFGTFGTGSV